MMTAHGLSVPDHLPFLDRPQVTRNADQIVGRLVALNAVAAASYGYPRTKTSEWLQRECVWEAVSPLERQFLEEGLAPERFQVQVEAAWALAYALGLVTDLDFWTDCESTFVRLLPDLKAGQSMDNWVQARSTNPRSVAELWPKLDLSFCLHWSIRQASLAGPSVAPRLKPYVVVERRRALEWLFANEPWDDVVLDT